MALLEALNKVIYEFGKDILIEPRLLNILNDYHGFDEMPYARFILKELQNDGFLALIIKMISFDQLKTKQISQRIHNRFGFDVTCVEQIISQVECDGKVLSSGEGKSKKQAEMEAARKALEIMKN